MAYIPELALFNSDERRLLTVMGLALVDGVFLGLIVSGGLASYTAAVQFGILLFSGSATAAVLLSSFKDQSLLSQLWSIIKVSIVIGMVAIVEAALAPTIQTIVYTGRLQVFAGLALLVIALSLVVDYEKYIPQPRHLMAVGLLFSIRFQEILSVSVVVEIAAIKYALVAVVTGMVTTAGLSIIIKKMGSHFEIRKLKVGSALALALLSLVILGVLPGSVPIAALGFAGVASIKW